MIFVTVGSQKFPFDRLVQRVDELAGEGIIREEVIIQTGACRYRPRHCRYQAYFDRKRFEELLERCSIVITHGGAGTIVTALRRQKKVIVVPRLARYGEHVDDHQLQLMEALGKQGQLCPCPETGRLAEALEEAGSRSYNGFRSNTEGFLASVEEYLSTL